MINYSDTKKILKNIDLEKKSLEATFAIQKNLNKQILAFMKTFLGDIKLELDFNPTNKTFYYINRSTSILNKSNENIDKLEDLLKQLNDIELKINDKIANKKSNSKTQTLTSTFQGSLIKAYNKDFSTCIDCIYTNTALIQEFLHDISLVNISEVLKNDIVSEEKVLDATDDIDNLVISSDDLATTFIENTLVISEIQGKIILPYKLTKVNEILLDNNDKYSSIQDVINKLYTVPIKNYKLSSISRFKEAYNLITQREKGSKAKALSLASELFFNYSLHPAIITACKNLDELDIYLACLEDNDLESFKFFDVKYEITPTVSTNKVT